MTAAPQTRARNVFARRIELQSSRYLRERTQISIKD